MKEKMEKPKAYEQIGGRDVVATCPSCGHQPAYELVRLKSQKKDTLPQDFEEIFREPTKDQLKPAVITRDLLGQIWAKISTNRRIIYQLIHHFQEKEELPSELPYPYETTIENHNEVITAINQLIRYLKK